MIQITKINKKQMQFEEIFKYISNNEGRKANIKEAHHKDMNDAQGNHIWREYIVVDKNDIVNKFIIERKIIDDNTDNDKFYLTHYYNLKKDFPIFDELRKQPHKVG